MKMIQWRGVSLTWMLQANEKTILAKDFRINDAFESQVTSWQAIGTNSPWQFEQRKVEGELSHQKAHNDVPKREQNKTCAFALTVIIKFWAKLEHRALLYIYYLIWV